MEDSLSFGVKEKSKKSIGELLGKMGASPKYLAVCSGLPKDFIASFYNKKLSQEDIKGDNFSKLAQYFAIKRDSLENVYNFCDPKEEGGVLTDTIFYIAFWNSGGSSAGCVNVCTSCIDISSPLIDDITQLLREVYGFPHLYLTNIIKTVSPGTIAGKCLDDMGFKE